MLLLFVCAEGRVVFVGMLREYWTEVFLVMDRRVIKEEVLLLFSCESLKRRFSPFVLQCEPVFHKYKMWGCL